MVKCTINFSGNISRWPYIGALWNVVFEPYIILIFRFIGKVLLWGITHAVDAGTIGFLSDNPNFVDELKTFTGEDDRVAAFVMDSDKAEGFMNHFSGMINYLLPEYIMEGKSYLTIGIGCTGGRHRSVAVAEGLAGRLIDGDYELRVLHRDKGRV